MTSANTIVVAIAHQDPFARACITAALQPHQDLVVQSDLSLEDLIHATDARLADCVVVSDFASGMRLGAAALASASRRQASRGIVIVCDSDREWELRAALLLQVRGFLAPGFSLDQLAESVRTVQRGARYLCARSAARLADSMSFEALTDREREVLTLVVDGLCNKSISKMLNISNGTVKSHLKSTYAKLNVVSRTQAVAVVERRGLLERRATVTAQESRPSVTSTALPSGIAMQRAGLASESSRALAH